MYERHERASDSPFVKSVVRQLYTAPGDDFSVPDGCWDLVFIRERGAVKVLHTGAITRPILLGWEPGVEYLCLTFRPGVYMPGIDQASMTDRGVLLPKPGSKSFRLETETFEIPTFENADDFAARLAGSGLLARDELVESVLDKAPMAASVRSLERHFLKATGLTSVFHRRIERARLAADLLRNGLTGAEAALEAGYSDQPHMIKSLKTLLGKTPTGLLLDS